MNLKSHLQMRKPRSVRKVATIGASSPEAQSETRPKIVITFEEITVTSCLTHSAQMIQASAARRPKVWPKCRSGVNCGSLVSAFRSAQGNGEQHQKCSVAQVIKAVSSANA
jgi:hypothetical protein